MKFNGWELLYPQDIGKIFVSGNHELILLIEDRIVIRLGVFEKRVIIYAALFKVDVDYATKKINLT